MAINSIVSMKRITLLFLLLLFSTIVEAQTILVKGKVTDSQKHALIGVAVGIKGTSIVTQTKDDGTYQIYSSYGDTLVFTSNFGVTKNVAVSKEFIDVPNNYLIINVELATDNQIFNMSLEELMSIEIITASNISEKLNDAPATTIVLSQKQILDLGYIKLSDILDDLPGMDMVKTYGDTYYKNYWRGFRNSVGTAYLLMVDGMLQNQLWTNTDQIMAAIPISNIERVEVVYGPASSVYGANALMGVINVLTKKTADTDGTHLSFQSFRSASNYFTGDYNVFYQRNNIRFSVTGRVEDGDVNEFINPNDFYWTRDEHYSNSALWGDVVNNKNLGGLFSSPERNRALDFRLYMDDLELGASFYNLSTGYGTVYPADRVQTVNRWPQTEFSIYSRYSKQLTSKISSRTLVRFRKSDITNDGLFIEAYNTTNNSSADSTIAGVVVGAGESVRGIDFSSWSTYNRSVSVFQDFDVSLSDIVSFNIGLKYENKNLERNYNAVYSDYVAPSVLTNASLLYPQITQDVDRYNNRVFIIDEAAYFQGRLRLNSSNALNIGARYDYNSQYGGSTTLRMGYVGTFKSLTAKLLYGQAYQEPTMRNLYGGWSGSGSNENLKPERSSTIEASAVYTKGKISALVSAYGVIITNTIVGDNQSASNLGERVITGLDLHLRTQISQSFIKNLNAWIYYSAILSEKEKRFDVDGNLTGTGIIGDLAHSKLYFGTTADIGKHLTINLRGRFIGERETVITNPIRTIPSYLTIDGNIQVRDVIYKGLNIEVKFINLTNTVYYHPGIREANSGESPGAWDSNGLGWSGSQGWFNSKLPQPRFFTMVGITLNI